MYRSPKSIKIPQIKKTKHHTNQYQRKAPSKSYTSKKTMGRLLVKTQLSFLHVQISDTPSVFQNKMDKICLSHHHSDVEVHTKKSTQIDIEQNFRIGCEITVFLFRSYIPFFCIYLFILFSIVFCFCCWNKEMGENLYRIYFPLYAGK